MHSFKFADLIPTSRDRSPLKLKDVQQNDLVISDQKAVSMLVGPTSGKDAMEATATFRVAEVQHLVARNLVRKGFSFNLGPGGCSMEKDGRKVPLHLETKQFPCGSSCFAARIETWMRGGGNSCHG